MDPKSQYAAWQFWFGVGQYFAAAVVGLYVWISNKDKARGKDIKAVKECTANDIKDVKDTTASAIATLEKQTARMDERIVKLKENMISHDDLGKVYERINEVSGQVRELSGTTHSIEKGVAMIHDHLLNGGKKQ